MLSCCGLCGKRSKAGGSRVPDETDGLLDFPEDRDGPEELTEAQIAVLLQHQDSIESLAVEDVEDQIDDVSFAQSVSMTGTPGAASMTATPGTGSVVLEMHTSTSPGTGVGTGTPAPTSSTFQMSPVKISAGLQSFWANDGDDDGASELADIKSPSTGANAARGFANLDEDDGFDPDFNPRGVGPPTPSKVVEFPALFTRDGANTTPQQVVREPAVVHSDESAPAMLPTTPTAPGQPPAAAAATTVAPTTATAVAAATMRFPSPGFSPSAPPAEATTQRSSPPPSSGGIASTAAMSPVLATGAEPRFPSPGMSPGMPDRASGDDVAALASTAATPVSLSSTLATPMRNDTGSGKESGDDAFFTPSQDVFVSPQSVSDFAPTLSLPKPDANALDDLFGASSPPVVAVDAGLDSTAATVNATTLADEDDALAALDSAAELIQETGDRALDIASGPGDETNTAVATLADEDDALAALDSAAAEPIQETGDQALDIASGPVDETNTAAATTLTDEDDALAALDSAAAEPIQETGDQALDIASGPGDETNTAAATTSTDEDDALAALDSAAAEPIQETGDEDALAALDSAADSAEKTSPATATLLLDDALATLDSAAPTSNLLDEDALAALNSATDDVADLISMEPSQTKQVDRPVVDILSTALSTALTQDGVVPATPITHDAVDDDVGDEAVPDAAADVDDGQAGEDGDNDPAAAAGADDGDDGDDGEDVGQEDGAAAGAVAADASTSGAKKKKKKKRNKKGNGKP